jgi:hypothetical protein
MSSSTAKMFKAMIRDAEDNIAALQDDIDTDLPPSPQLLQTIHNLQHMFRGNIDKLQDSIAELK